jgi:hypothetical protein
MAPSTATPSALPSERRKVNTPVATPRCFWSTAFWTETVVTGKVRPMPIPAMSSKVS